MKTINKCHLFFAAGAFSQTKMLDKSWKICECLENHENHEKYHIFFAAGAFSQKNVENNHENM